MAQNQVGGIVVSGHGLIQECKLGTDEIIEFEVTSDNIQCIHKVPGYTHNIINLSDTEHLVTVMYCNEISGPNRPDTYFEKVQGEMMEVLRSVGKFGGYLLGERWK